jgi:hypothetical protein
MPIDPTTVGDIAKHEDEYKPSAWEAYSIFDLGCWVHVLASRAKHRAKPEGKAQDIYDARNYLAMMSAKLDEIEKAPI